MVKVQLQNIPLGEFKGLYLFMTTEITLLLMVVFVTKQDKIWCTTYNYVFSHVLYVKSHLILGLDITTLYLCLYCKGFEMELWIAPVRCLMYFSSLYKFPCSVNEPSWRLKRLLHHFIWLNIVVLARTL